jgi:hypothetical protein
MAVLQSPPFNLVFDQIVIVRASASSAVGFGTVSTTNTMGAKIKTTPLAITNLVVASQSDRSITLRWDAMLAPASGNSDVLGYNIFWDMGSGNAASVELANVSSSTYTTSQVVTGRIYQLKVRARNLYGYGPFSEIVPSSAISVPQKSSTPIVSKDPTNSTRLKVSW